MGKITIDELSNELKEYMNGLGLTEEQVQALIDAGLVDINNNLESLTTKVNNSQNYKLTNDNGYSKTITSGSVNDIKTAGWYVLGENVSDCPLRDQGYHGWFHLEVIGSDSNWLKQTITVLEATGYGTRTWVRGMQNGTWAPWRELVDESQIYNVCETNGAVKVITNIDLKNLKDTGFYNGSSLTNSPDSSIDWWYVEVMQHSNLNGYVYQIATSLANAEIVKYHRQCQGGTWGSWRSL